MKVKATINNKVLQRLNVDMCKALKETTDALKSDVQQSQTMPFDSGELQNRSFFIDTSDLSKGRVVTGNDKPYARRLYFHPEYKFHKEPWIDSKGRQHGGNPNAGGLWFEPYISGNKKNFASKVFARLLKKRMK